MASAKRETKFEDDDPIGKPLKSKCSVCGRIRATVGWKSDLGPVFICGKCDRGESDWTIPPSFEATEPEAS